MILCRVSEEARPWTRWMFVVTLLDGTGPTFSGFLHYDLNRQIGSKYLWYRGQPSADLAV